MTRELKILKGVLLLRGYGNPHWDGNRYQTKEEQIEEVRKYYSDKVLDEWIQSLIEDCKKSKEEIEKEHEEFCKRLEEQELLEIQHEMDYLRHEEESRYYSPSCPWNAPGMSVRDFI